MGAIAFIVLCGLLGNRVATIYSDSGWKHRTYFGLSIETPFRLNLSAAAPNQVPEALRPLALSVHTADSERTSNDMRISVTKLVLKPGTQMDLDKWMEVFLAALPKGLHTAPPERSVEALRLPGLEVRRYFAALGKVHGKEVHSTGILARNGEDLWDVVITFGLSAFRPDADRILDSIHLDFQSR